MNISPVYTVFQGFYCFILFALKLLQFQTTLTERKWPVY